jgi:hypothetical protein
MPLQRFVLLLLRSQALPINGFSAAGRVILEYFNFNDQINRLDEANLLFLVVK